MVFDEQGREIPLPDIDDEEGGAAFDEDDFEEEAETADGPEDDPYGLAGGWFDRYEQICFARVAGTDGLYAGVFRAEDGRLYVNRLSAVTFDNSELVRYRYDGRGDLTAVYGRDGKKLRGFAYRNHIMVEHSQPDGLVSHYRYDRYERNGKVLESSNNAGERWTFDYRDGHTVVSDVLGRTETFGFDANRELIYHIDAAGRREQSERDDFGRITVQTDALGRQTRYSYDEAGNLIAVTAPDGGSTLIDYDDELNLPLAVTDNAGRLTEYGYDARGNLTSITDPSGHITRYRYTAAGLPESITDALGKSKQLEYDACGLLVRYTDCSGQSTRFSYNALGELTGITDALGHSTRHHYDGAGNPVRTDYPDGSHESFEYDHLNRLSGYTDGLGARTAYELAVDGLPLKRTDALGHSFAYGYDPARRLTVLTNENGAHYRLDYDAADNLIRESGWDGKITEYGYDEAGQLREQREYGSDPMGRLQRQRSSARGADKRNAPAGAVSRSYAYDKAGNLIQSADHRSGVLNYVYDKLGRIQEARNSQTGHSEKFAFDPAGNILSANQPAAARSGRLKTPANPNLYAGNRLKEHNGTEYTYDGLGNLIYRQLPDGENQYFQYDTENQLVRAEIKKKAGNTEIWEYAYDPFGRRLSKERKDKLAWTSTEPKRTRFVWDGSRLAQEYTYQGSYTHIYTDQDSYEPLAQIFYNAKDEKQYLAYIHTDQIGIPREMTDMYGNLLWYGEYSAWGRLKKDERVYPNAHQPFRLQNQYYDRETGLHYNLMRYYEAETGRFINQDPIGLFGGNNLYSFGNQALDFVDPLGLKIYGHRKDGTFRKKPGPKSKKKRVGKGECIQNKIDGDAREALHKKGLDAQYGPDRILSQKHLRNKKGEIVSDPLTGESRKLDFVIKGAGKDGGAHAQEVTSLTASKTAQALKEGRIRDAGGVYVRDGKSLIKVDGLSEIVRLP